jgi:hypothetical protein
MLLLLLRKLWFRRQRSNTENAPCAISIAIESGASTLEIQGKEPQLPDVTFTTAPRNETETIVDQLALLADAVSHTSNTTQHAPPTSVKAETQQSTSTAYLPAEKTEEIEETFYYLSSLITVSCLPSHTPARSTSTLATQSKRRKSLEFDGKRTSSILNLNIEDLPSLPFPRRSKSKHNFMRKPGPRYSPLPPPFVKKSLAMRPEVRF